MAETYSEFLAEHRAEHRSAFNRWTLVVGDAMQLLGALALLARRRRFGLTMLTLGLGVTAAGHVRDGNLPKSLETARTHPIWNIRGDLAIARDALTGR